MNFSGVVVALFFIVIAQGYVISPDSRIRSRRETEEPKMEFAEYRIDNRTITLRIGDRLYSAKIPEKLKFALDFETYTENDDYVEIVEARFGDEIDVYKTVGGRTTVTDEKGNVRHDGGHFHVRT
ncbi:hypothetical protein DICVIV_13944 [Dictyocaulus viviparus]|uniref:Uncharacterized protein n=1 Tax=Dictyocaulus viviparus TaxID=29172 RepID=A0A0D8X6I5_DICVI|nr:hypothetical protein DICVIV_13944 [Dictyocaulus viviparus]